jgi:hypothetical protein
MAAMSRGAAHQQDKKDCKWRTISTLLFEDSNNKTRDPDNLHGDGSLCFDDETNVLFSLGHL